MDAGFFLNYIILCCKIRIVKYTISRHVIIAVSVLSVRFVVKKHPPPLFFFKATKISTYNSNDLINHLWIIVNRICMIWNRNHASFVVPSELFIIYSRDFLRNRKHQLCVKKPLLCDIELTGLMNEVIDIRHSLKKTVEVSMCNRYRLKRLCSLAILIVMQSVKFVL